MLLTRNDLTQLQLDPHAIGMVPEAIARNLLVLPVRYEDEILHLILPAETDLGDDDSIEKLRVVLECAFTYQFAVTDDLRPFVDFYYTAVYSEIKNCEPRWKFQCPKRWADLARTPDVRVRYCSTCNRSVTFCRDEMELTQLAARNECVAFMDGGAQHYETLGLLDLT